MKDLAVVIVGGASGLGALLASRVVEEGAAGVGIIDINVEAARAALKPAKEKGLKTAVAACDRYFPAFQYVLWAGKSAREALATALFETAGEA